MSQGIRLILLWAVVVVVGTSGCEAPQRSGEPVSQIVPAQSVESSDAVWMASQDVLRRNGFQIDRLDRRAGIITTHPETSKQFFEFWRNDVGTLHDFLEASLRTVRRTVEIAIVPAEGADQPSVRVTVRRETYATPDRQFNSSLAAFQMFGTQLPSVTTGEKIARSDDHWIADGRDIALEQQLLDQVMQQLGAT